MKKIEKELMVICCAAAMYVTFSWFGPGVEFGIALGYTMATLVFIGRSERVRK